MEVDMRTVVKLVKIIAEDEIEPKLLHDLEAIGVKGYTLSTVRGKGLHRFRGSEWEGENVQIETLVSEELAEEILRLLEEEYFAHFSVTAFVQDALVVRGQKYT
jgi:nitrogen regulatory protein PII